MAAQSQPVSADRSTITYPKVDKALIARIRWFAAGHHPIQNFAQASRKAGGIPDLNTFKHNEQLRRTCGWLDLLEFDTNMSPELNNKAKIGLVLELINRPHVHFPENVKQRAEGLLQSFQAENWGAAVPTSDDYEEGEEDDEEEEVASPITTVATTARSDEPESATVTIRLPPPGHLIWGENGIMRGVAVTSNGKKKLDPRYQRDRRSAKISGHNGLDVGAWFPTRLSALANGAHGASQAGITGNTAYGAFSIVVATTYKEVDEE